MRYQRGSELLFGFPEAAVPASLSQPACGLCVPVGPGRCPSAGGAPSPACLLVTDPVWAFGVQ